MIDSRPASDGHERPRAAARAWADLHDVEIRDSGPSTGTEVVLAYFDCMAGEEMPNVRLHRVSGCKPPLLRHQAGTDPDVLAGSRTPPYRIPSVSRPARCRSCRTLPPSTRGGLRAMRRKATRRMLTHGNVYAAPLARPGGRSAPPAQLRAVAKSRYTQRGVWGRVGARVAPDWHGDGDLFERSLCRLLPPASMYHLTLGTPSIAQVTGRLLTVSDGDRSDRGELWRHPEFLAERVDPVGGNAEETGSQAGINRSEQHQQRGETRIDVPVRRRPPSIGTIRVALVRLGIAFEVGVLIRERNDQQRRLDVRGKPSLRLHRRTRGSPEEFNVCGAVKYQKSPTLGETSGGCSQTIVDYAVDNIRWNRPIRIVTANHAPVPNNVLKLHCGNVPESA